MTITIEKIKAEKFKVTFLLKGITEVFANTIRRMIIEEVPTLAIEDIDVKDNNSALYDEMLALRLGLIPIKTDLKSYNLKHECKCAGEGCAQCQLMIILKSNKKGYVYAEEAESTDPKCTFVYPETPIVKLLAKQKLDLSMIAILGKGKEHVKWSPGLAWYQKEAKLKMGKVSQPEKLAAASSDGVFTYKNNKLTLNEDKIYQSNLLEHYAQYEGVEILYTNNFVFILESWGQLSCKNILEKSADLLVEKIEALAKQL